MILSFRHLAAAAPALLLAAAAPTLGHQWKTISNATFGFSACYPADLFRPAGDKLNVGGQRFAGPGGAALVISGLANPDNESLVSAADGTIPNTFALKRAVTYRVVRPGWAVVSGRMGDGKLFYERVIRKGRDYAFFFMAYPADRAAQFSPLPGRMGRCLR